MPTLLSASVVRDALSRLSGWSGGTGGIERTLHLSPDQYGAFTERLKVCSDALNHRPHLHRSGDVLQVWLCTDAEGGVTDSDIALAARIEYILTALAAAPSR
jgi:pterin-4a-carbinolamine dehydratase